MVFGIGNCYGDRWLFLFFILLPSRAVLPNDDFRVVLLFWARGGSAVSDGGFEEFDEIGGDVGLFFNKVVLFLVVGGHVVELAGFAVVAFRPSAGAFGGDELPVALADGEAATDGMVDDEGSRWWINSITVPNRSTISCSTTMTAGIT
jgi:hypothetical protein